MAVHLISETGAGLADANGYGTVEESNDYAETASDSDQWLPLDESVKQARIIQATRAIDLRFRWNGWRASTTQALEFPRTGLYQSSGNLLSSSVVPEWLKWAVFEWARLVQIGDPSMTGAMVEQSVSLGSASVTYANAGGTAAIWVPPTVVSLVPSWAIAPRRALRA